MGSNFDGWCLDRCRQSSRDRRDQWHSSLPGTPRIQSEPWCLHTDIQWILMVKQGTNRRTQHQLELEIENMGGHLNAYTSVWIDAGER